MRARVRDVRSMFIASIRDVLRRYGETCRSGVDGRFHDLGLFIIPVDSRVIVV